MISKKDTFYGIRYVKVTRLLPGLKRIKMIFLVVFLTSGLFIKSHLIDQPSSIDELIVNADKEKLDKIMTTWFDSFQKYQEEGKTIVNADKLASIDAVNECLSDL
jgi:hypothetical protein